MEERLCTESATFLKTPEPIEGAGRSSLFTASLVTGPRSRLIPAVIVFLVGALVAPAFAQVEGTDILGSLGDFENDGFQKGIANGWNFSTSSSARGMARIINDGVTPDSRCQFIAMRRTSGWGYVSLSRSIAVGGSNPLQVGDLLKSSVHLRPYRLINCEIVASITCFSSDWSTIDTSYYEFADYAANGYDLVETTVTIPDGTKWVSLRVQAVATNTTASGGVYIDDACLLVQSDRREAVPCPERELKTVCLFNCDGDPAYVASHYDVVIACPWLKRRLGVLRSHNPEMKVYLYQGSSITEDFDDPNTICPAGPWSYIAERRPYWILRDAVGNEIRGRSISYQVMLDVGDPQYKYVWARQAARNARAAGVDGIYVDQLVKEYSWLADVYSTKYPTQESWAKAVDSFMRYVAPSVKRRGVEVAWNGGAADFLEPFYARWMNLIDTALLENSFVRTRHPDGPYYHISWWRRFVNNITCYPDKTMFVMIDAPKEDDAMMSFSMASFLLCKGANTYIGLEDQGTTAEDIYTPYFEIQPGEPLGLYEEVTPNVFLREFENMLVVVNPSDGPEYVQFDRSYVDYHGVTYEAGQHSIPDHTGLLLYK